MLFTTGLSFPEGPVLLPDSSWLVVEMGADRGCVTHISPDGKSKRRIAKTGRPNGLAVDNNGGIWVAETQTPSLLHMTLDGKVETVMTECNGEAFLFPNDLCFGPDGALYLTDSGVLVDEMMPGGKVRPDFQDLRIDGRVYRFDISRMEIQKLDSGIRFSNGIAFGPDNRLYVTESLTGSVYRYSQYDCVARGLRESFGNVTNLQVPGGLKAPDGIAFGEDGKLYVAVFGQGDVTVLDNHGNVIDRIRTRGRLPTNVAFGPKGSRELFVTEDEFGEIETFEVTSDGWPLYS
jgi:gluconolactonase